MKELIQWQEKSRKKLYKLLGDLPDRNYPVKEKLKIIQEGENYILEKLVLDLNGYEDVPAYFVKPKNLKKPTACIIFNHSHGGKYLLGKEEFIKGNDYMQSPPYADVVVSLGYTGICIDHINFGERSGRDETDLFKELIWKGKVLWGLMVYDSIKTVDYVITRKEVDSSRIGTIGMSMGSTMAWWLSALDTRIKVCVDICCLTDFHSLIEKGNLKGHGIYYFVPSLLKYFTTSKINALIAPRAHLSVAGIYDILTPEKGLDRIDKQLREIYRRFKKENNWKLTKYNCGHIETSAMRKEIIDFLKEKL